MGPDFEKYVGAGIFRQAVYFERGPSPAAHLAMVGTLSRRERDESIISPL